MPRKSSISDLTLQALSWEQLQKNLMAAISLPMARKRRLRSKRSENTNMKRFSDLICICFVGPCRRINPGIQKKRIGGVLARNQSFPRTGAPERPSGRAERTVSAPRSSEQASRAKSSASCPNPGTGHALNMSVIPNRRTKPCGKCFSFLRVCSGLKKSLCRDILFFSAKSFLKI